MGTREKDIGRSLGENSLLYELQFMRGLNPVYVFLTKKGVVASIILYLIYDKFGGSLFLTLTGVLTYWFIYKKFYDYTYYELEKVWIVRVLIDFVTIPRYRKKRV